MTSSPDEQKLNCEGVNEGLPSDATEMLAAVDELLPICRSITGDGLRQTLRWLGKTCPIDIVEIPSGTQVFDWTVPPEWNVRSASLTGPDGRQVCSLSDSPLRIVNYSHAIDGVFSLDQLHSRLHSLPSYPNWLPYRTSYYAESWGFCLRHRELLSLAAGDYHAQIAASHDPAGSLSLGEVVLPGRSKKEVLFSSHCCHPGMANDNLSGFVVAWKLCQWLSNVPNRKYTYRFIFAPGTIGAIAWLATHQHLFPNIVGGLVLALLGDRQCLTYKASRSGNTRIDAIVAAVLNGRDARRLAFSPTGYDERQFGARGIELPIGRLTRSCEGEYEQYHSSGDDQNLISGMQLLDSLRVLKSIVTELEDDVTYQVTAAAGELQLGKRGLYQPAAAGGLARSWLLSHADGERGINEIAGLSQLAKSELQAESSILEAAGLLKRSSDAIVCDPADKPVDKAGRYLGRKQESYSQRAAQRIPGGAHTYAKGVDQFPRNAPEAIVGGHGCRVVDAFGREFVEFGAGLRSVSLGHAFPSVVEAAAAQMKLGANFVRPATIEVDVAEELLSILPAADMVKFAKNGSDVTTAAIRLSRAATGREKVLLCGDQPFFSVDDWFISQTPMNSGIPHEVAGRVVRFPYGDLQFLEDLLKERGNDFACLIMEAETYSPPAPGYLLGVQSLCNQHGVLFVLDEMITGFRWNIGGAQAEYGLTPDLSAFGKAMGNGFAVAALAGKREFMQLGGLEHDARRVFLLSTTHGAETHALAAAKAVIRTYKDEPVIEHLHEVGQRLRVGLEGIARDLDVLEYFHPLGRSCNLIFATKNKQGIRCQQMRTILLSELVRHGVLAPSLVVGYSHDQDAIETTLDAFAKALKIYRRALHEGPEKFLDGPASKPVFREYN